jgi:hypothetical protein
MGWNQSLSSASNHKAPSLVVFWQQQSTTKSAQMSLRQFIDWFIYLVSTCCSSQVQKTWFNWLPNQAESFYYYYYYYYYSLCFYNSLSRLTQLILYWQLSMCQCWDRGHLISVSFGPADGATKDWFEKAPFAPKVKKFDSQRHGRDIILLQQLYLQTIALLSLCHCVTFNVKPWQNQGWY